MFFLYFKSGSKAGKRIPESTTNRRSPAFLGLVVIVLRYRQAPDPDRRASGFGLLLSSFMWFWILWHSWHAPEELYGHFVGPDPSKWTDEELGIPPDDYVED
uniref:NADH dehydrogenase [ubiquinone] 1 beta subcomplex subunit 2, mitochondrial n=1 Tax=Eptatretus burgeri TaxID=7764 RepID=A0A8C4QEL7_EPTBU